ncbi:MAG: alpha/beta hydrolase [Acidimicrobiales bacterium]
MRRRVVAPTLVLVATLLAACSADQGVRSTDARPIDSDAPATTEASPDTTEPSPDTTTADTTPDTTDQAATGTLEWGPCDDPMVTEDTLDCATLTVPLDPDDPTGDTIDIAMVRVPAADPSTRVGAILFNPGGPGASGFDQIAQAGTTLVDQMGLGDFDLIGFDPRGVDRSNGLRCLSDEEIDATMYLDDTPDTPEEQAALDASSTQFDDACIAEYGDTLQYYSTVNTAKDMDAIRAALGDDQISYLGISYGTYLGSVYATLFPERVRAMVLDSAYEPTGDSIEEQYTTQLVGFDQAFDNWANWCQTDDSCAFRSADVAADWDALRAQLDATPVPASDGRQANQAVLESATFAALYSEVDWPLLGTALAEARNGNGDKLFVLADGYAGRDDDGTYSTLEQSLQIITCASGIDYGVPDDPQALVDELLRLSPRFAAGTTVDDFGDGCADLMPDVTPPTLSYTGEAPILVVGGTNDPATPFRWAEEMTAAMGSSARLLTYTGEGHGQVLNSTCVTDFEAATLVELELPDEGAVCDPDPDVPKPDWWDGLPVPDGVSDVIDSSGINATLGLTPSLAFSESRTSTLTVDQALDAYDAAMEAAGWTVAGRQEPITGVPQAVYFDESGAVFSVLAFGPDAFASPDLDGLDEVADPNVTLLVLLAF